MYVCLGCVLFGKIANARVVLNCWSVFDMFEGIEKEAFNNGWETMK
jgi:hypothetical protein